MKAWWHTWWGVAVIPAALGLVVAAVVLLRPDPRPALDYHRGAAEATSDMVFGLQVVHDARAAELESIEAAKEEAIHEYLNDTDALCDTLDRLAR